MDDDKQDKAGITPGSDAAKRPPPTIELTASSVSDSTPDATAESHTPEADASSSASAADHSEPAAAEKSPSSRTSSILVSALTGAAAAALVLGAAHLAGWPEAPAQKPVADLVSKSDVDALGTRLAKIESEAAKPAPAARPVADPAIVTRLDALEKSLAAIRSDVAAARGQSEKVAAALGEIKSASPQAVIAQSAPAADTSAFEERLDKIERATAALGVAALTPPPAPQPPAEDPNLRRVAAATVLDSAVRQGEPYAAALAAARSASGDSESLKPLDGFAATGVPTAKALSRDLLALLPKPDAQPAPSGMVERLQQSAAKLVRIQRVDATASGNAAVVARAASAAQRDDVSEAKRELMQLPASDRGPVQAWIAKADAREAALAASRQFASDTMAALSKPAR